MRNGKSKCVLIKKGDCACNNGEDNDDHKIYAYMARMSNDDKRESGEFGDTYASTF